jgi:hypothetical protein
MELYRDYSNSNLDTSPTPEILATTTTVVEFNRIQTPGITDIFDWFWRHLSQRWLVERFSG